MYDDFLKSFEQVYGRIVVSFSVPRLNATPDYAKLSLLLQRKYRGNIKVAERKLREKDMDLAR